VDLVRGDPFQQPRHSGVAEVGQQPETVMLQQEATARLASFWPRTAPAQNRKPHPGHPCPHHPLTQARNPSCQLAYRGFQPSFLRAFSFDGPREVVIWATTNSPVSNRPSQPGTRRGGFAPATSARYGSHSATGAGSSSTTGWAASQAGLLRSSAARRKACPAQG